VASKLSLLTSRSAVEEAIAECDALTRDIFLKKYRYKRSRLYPLEFGGRIYDSKAIVGVAFGKQHGTPLRAGDFSGGQATVVRLLRSLNFFIQETPHPATALVAGRTYLRKNLIKLYGGQLQGGIWTPKEFPVVFLFSGGSGKLYGYQDGWTQDDFFEYTGEGQSGDMKFRGGNKAIRDHRADGRDLMLFTDLGKGKGVRFEGLFECASWREMDGFDKERRPRKIIVFDLVRVGAAAASESAQTTADAVPLSRPITSIDSLRRSAYTAAANSVAGRRAGNAKCSWYERCQTVREYVLARAKGVCEACDKDAPFCKRDGTPYLEPHHTTRLADEGLDHPKAVGAICPTCHRRIHSGLDGDSWNQQLQKRLADKESDIGNFTEEIYKSQ
jgi:5-methylcytosine-specific restriction enzyme A